ncbi:alpha/beta fold hydrolase [Plantibacter sp. YIM 135249]|uniref:alpha/beta fold hydrolase n=1 Tax=Plantibacter sp. YIM 135249 TaxID=3423918 RepID=UPI003D32CA4F
MRPSRFAAPFIISIAALTPSLAGCAAPTAAPNIELEWESCDELVKSVAQFADMVGAPDVLGEFGDRLECAEVPVPRDHTDPSLGTLTVQISRLTPEQDSEGVIFTNPAGPGLEGRTTPALLAQTGFADLLRTHTLIGIDVRGTGAGGSARCANVQMLEVPPGEDSDAQRAKTFAGAVAEANRDCVAEDVFARNLTTRSIAEDLDLVRTALGLERISYFGQSWGTELGTQYRSMFPDRLENILLDSMTDLHGDANNSLADIAAAREHFPAVTPEPAGNSAETYSPLAYGTRTTITCNTAINATDDDENWDAYLQRQRHYLTVGAERIAHPVASELPGVSACSGWPLDSTPVTATARPGTLQFVAHAQETVTPAVWTEHAQRTVGGNVFTLNDAQHAGLPLSEAADDAVAFLTADKQME